MRFPLYRARVPSSEPPYWTYAWIRRQAALFRLSPAAITGCKQTRRCSSYGIVSHTGGREITVCTTHTWRLEGFHFWKPIKSGQGAANNCKSYTWKQKARAVPRYCSPRSTLTGRYGLMIRYYKIIMTGFITYLLAVTFSGWGTGGTSFTLNNTSIVGALASTVCAMALHGNQNSAHCM